ncbi:MAG: endoglucanase [Clostridium sp.]|nr:endoglucanase [Clostridium sp.]
MIKARTKLLIASVICGATLLAPVATSAATLSTKEAKENFLEMRKKMSDPANGYYKEFKANGKTLKVPYHAVETFCVEAPDYGHETTSETYSYYMWLEAMYGKFTGDWKPFKDSWASTEKFIIPTSADQPSGGYNPNKPATLANEYLSTSKYPSKMDFGAQVGQDKIYNELKSTYGTDQIYGMHWLLDTDNWYEYGVRGKKGDNSAPVYINTYQRGGNESVWKTVPHPSWEQFQAGKDGGQEGFLSLFTGDDHYSKQWRYTIASDADARAIQATYWADVWAKEQEKGSEVKSEVEKATKMGDYLRYSMFDKYFREIGTASNDKQGENKHYLLGWYYSWGGDLQGQWSWRIGCSHNHFGYQNPMAAWVLSTSNTDDSTSDFSPKSPTASDDWAKSLDRQLEFYQWLQSDEGGIAGGATNSYTTDQGSYQNYPAGHATFYGMAYDPAPVYLDPSSNRWFGMQAWSMQRMAEYYYQTGDKRAGTLLDKWVKWVENVVKLNADGTYNLPANLKWSGQPDTWNGTYTGNPNLHVEVETYGTGDIGLTGSLSNTLSYYAAACGKHRGVVDEASKNLSAELLTRMWNLYKDDKGLASSEVPEYNRVFDTEVFVPQGWTGKMGNGDKIFNGNKFIDIRSKYKKDPDYARVKEAYDAGKYDEINADGSSNGAVFKYHRYWAQTDAAVAYGTYALLFEGQGPNLGDVNGDGKVNTQDYAMLKLYLAKKIKASAINMTNADVNEDGVVNVKDLLALRQMI